MRSSLLDIIDILENFEKSSRMGKSHITLKSLDEFILVSGSKIFILIILSYIFSGVLLWSH